MNANVARAFLTCFRGLGSVECAQVSHDFPFSIACQVKMIGVGTQPLKSTAVRNVGIKVTLTTITTMQDATALTHGEFKA